MSKQQKIHVFLGAPSPPSDPPSVSGPGLESVVRSRAGWRHLELTWTDGRLRPAVEGGGDHMSTGQGHAPSEADWTTEASQADHGPEVPDEPGPEDEDQCSASVHEYLDRCFPAAQPEPEPGLDPGPEPEPPLCPRTQYLSTWTLSQALILRGRQCSQSATSPEKAPPPQTPPSTCSSTPDLFSPLTPSSPGPSPELFSPPCSTPRVEEGGVVLEATADGVLCSQEAEPKAASYSPAKSPDVKRTRVSEDARVDMPPHGAAARLRGPTTLLVRCQRPGARCSVLVAVVHPCHLKEVQVRSGPSAGTTVPLASIVVTDQSGVEMKVVLWRRAAFWVLTVSPGDILLITGLQVSEDRWRGETLLQSTFSSKLLTLGQVAASISPPVPQHVDARSLSALCEYLRERRPLLVSLPRHPPQDLTRLPYATLRSLKVNTLVHALLRVTHTHMSSAWRSEAESRCRSARQLTAVVTVEQPGGQQGALLLWGAAVDWLPRLNRGRALVWDFHVLLVREGLTSDLPELHSTPWSSVRPLDRSDRRALDFIAPIHRQTGSSSTVELDLDTLLSQRHSGEVELRVHVTSFHFQDALSSQNAPQPVLDSSTPLDDVVEVLSGDVTYTGCGRCGAELETDANGIYGPCYPCLPHTTVRRYYRPAVLTVSGRSNSQVCVQVPPLTLLKIFDAPPDKLHRISAPGSQVKHIQVAAERIQTLLSLPRKTFPITIRSHFLCDENSVPLFQDFTLLDLQFPDGL